MKKLFLAVASLALVAVASAMVVVYQGPLVNESGLAYNKDYTLDTFNTKIDYIGAQAVYAKAAPAAVTFTDGTPSTATITISSNPVGGFATATIIAINGTTLISSRDWTWASTSSGTAKAISDAIQANTTLQPLIASTWTAGGIVFATSTAVGTALNYTLTSSTPTAVVVAGFTNGTASTILNSSNKINKANTFTTGLALLYTKTAGTSPANLVANTTYYGIAVDLNNFKLATSTTAAVAGTAISISTSAAQGGGTFVLTPLTYAGTPSFKWQASNDGVNFTDLSVSSITYTAASTTASSTIWDFAAYDYHYLKCSVLGPTTGGFQIVVTLVGKNTESK